MTSKIVSAKLGEEAALNLICEEVELNLIDEEAVRFKGAVKELLRIRIRKIISADLLVAADANSAEIANTVANNCN